MISELVDYLKELSGINSSLVKLYKKWCQMFSVEFLPQKTAAHYADILNSFDPYVMFKINPNAEVVKKAFQVKQKKFRLFSSRFQLGRLCKIPDKKFLLIYPEEYKIYVFDYRFNLEKELYPDSHSRYIPSKAEFPGILSPYDFTPEHSKWWGQSLRPAMIFYLDGGTIACQLAEFFNLSVKSYVNIHNLNGTSQALGLEVPFNGIIRYAKGEYIYVVEDSKFDENKNVTPLKLHRFKMMHGSGGG